jgi:hypothetical protein
MTLKKSKKKAGQYYGMHIHLQPAIQPADLQLAP